MKIGCLLSVREKATRLPKKVLLDIAGQPLTKRLLQRLSMANKIDQIILSTSVHSDDRLLVDLARDAGFEAFQGSEDDKLDRYHENAIAFGLDAVVIVDGDDLLCFPEGIDLVARRLREGGSDCVSMPGLPLGAACTGLTTPSLETVLQLKDESDTEVWGGYFFGSGRFKASQVEVENSLWRHPEVRLTLDYQEDYELLLAIFKEFDDRIDFTSDELMDLLVNRKPELTEINAEAQLLYEAHITNSAPVKFRENIPPSES